MYAFVAAAPASGAAWEWVADVEKQTLGFSPVTASPSPFEVSKLKLVRELRALGRWDACKTALDVQPVEVQEDWAYASQIRSDDPQVRALAKAVGLTDADIDGAFERAKG